MNTRSKGWARNSAAFRGGLLIWAYMFIGIAGVTGFTHFATKLLAMTGASGYLSHPSITLFAICAFAAWFLAYKDIQFFHDPHAYLRGHLRHTDYCPGGARAGQNRAGGSRPLHPTGHGMKDIGLGVVVAIFSLVGFECATAFGEESKKPLVIIPRAVIASLLLTGAFLRVYHLCGNACAGEQ